MKTKTKPLTKHLIICAIYLIIIAIVIFVGVLPQYRNLTKKQEELGEIKTELNAISKKRTNLTKIAKEKGKIEQTKQTIYEYLPPNKDNSDFVVKVEALAKELSINISAFSFTATKEKTNTDKSAESKSTKKETVNNSSEFSINFTTNFGSIIQFTEKLESFPRLNIVDTLAISGYDKTNDTLNFRLTGRIFYGQ